MKPSTDRVKKHQAKKRADGFVRVEFWLRPEWVELVKQFVKQLESGK